MNNLPKNLPEGTQILDMNSPTFAEDFAKLLGIAPVDEIVFTGPQFERTDGVTVAAPPKTIQEWAELPKLSSEKIREMGIGVWEKENGMTHYLFPKEWFNYIPQGLLCTFISGEIEPFDKATTDDDYRFGCLAFGFIVKDAK